MKNIFFSILILMLLFCGINLAQAQDQTEYSSRQTSVKPALDFEYFSRTLSWDKNKYTSKLKSLLFSIDLKFEVQEGFDMGLILGYTLSNYDGMAFRELPFSVELGVGNINGYFFGGELNKNIVSQDNFTIDFYGQFIYMLGKRNSWSIPGLNVEGTVEGKPTWMLAQAGPVFTYMGFDSFHPYVFVSFNKLWGTFKMDETVQNLKGSENKKFSTSGVINMSFGTIYEVSESFNLKGQVNIIPYSNGFDFGVKLMAVFAF